jgi:NADPH:quinone reductase-like Zn-dependent oxidoreductase
MTVMTTMLPSGSGFLARLAAAARVTHPDAAQLADLLARAASGDLPARVHAVVPLDQVGDAQRAVAKGGLRGRYVLKP